jgi:hypothetical protein
MIELTSELCDELSITFWQLNDSCETNQEEIHTISREEQELLKKILLAKGIVLSNKILKVEANGVVLINCMNYQLIFNDVKLADSKTKIHLSKLSEMLTDIDQKKRTWFKLKNL